MISFFVVWSVLLLSMFPNCYIIILHHQDMFIKITTRKGCLSFYDFNMRLTNVVYQGEMNCVLNLNFLTQQLINVRYSPRSFPGVIYQNRKIGGNCLIFSNGKINCNGPCESFSQGLKRLRKYARVIQKLGYDVRLQNVRLVTASACHKLSGKVNASSLSKSLNFSYDPELFPAVMLRRDGIHSPVICEEQSLSPVSRDWKI